MMSERSVLKKMDKVTTLKEAVICIKVYYDLAQRRRAEISQAAIPQEKVAKSPTTKSPQPGPSLSPCPRVEIPLGLLDSGKMLSFFLDAHDSFLLIVSDSGRILFSSELVTSLLGQMQTRLMGQNVFDYVHPRNKATIQSLFVVAEDEKGTSLPNSPLIGFPSRTFTAHFKLYSSETNCKSQYLPFVCLSFLRKWAEPSQDCLTPSDEEVEPQKTCTVIIGKLPTSLAMVDLAVSTNDVNFEFDMHISQKGHIIDIDKHAVMVFGYSIAELIGTLFFEYVDPYHITEVGDSMSKFLSEGIGSTTPYRLRTKGGRCIWVISKGYLSYDPWNNKLNHILLVNRVLGCDQVLPEHRFFESTKHLPDQEGREESYYTPNLDAVIKPDPSPSIICNSAPVSRPFASSITDHTHATHPHSSSLATERGSADSFPHLSTGTSVLTPLEGTLDMAYQVFSEGSGSGQWRGRVPGEMGGVSTVTPPTLARTSEPKSTMGGGAAGGVASAGDKLQRELEERSLKLLEMQRKLMEQEQQFNKDRMQFFQAAQKMMQQLSQGVGGDMAATMPSLSSSYMEPNAILESMKPLTAGESAAPSPLSAMSPHSMMGRGEQSGMWGGVASPASSMSSQQQQQQGNMQHHSNIPQQHGNIQQRQQQHRQVDHLMYGNTPPSSGPSFADISRHHSHPQQHHSPQHQNFSPQNYTNPPFSNSNPLYGRTSMDSNPLCRSTSQDEVRFQSPLNCLPYDRHQHQSLDEHNMQFLQQQPQPQPQPQPQQRPEALFNSPVGSQLLMGSPGGSSVASGASSKGGEGGGGGGRRGDFSHIMQGGNMLARDMDLTDILHSTSSFNT